MYKVSSGGGLAALMEVNEMANIDWHIIGQITPEGKIRISGFSFGGDKLFDSPIELDEMIDALAASHEMPPDLLLSPSGRKELAQLAAILSKAGSGVRDRLRNDETKSEQVKHREGDDVGETTRSSFGSCLHVLTAPQRHWHIIAVRRQSAVRIGLR